MGVTWGPLNEARPLWLCCVTLLCKRLLFVASGGYSPVVEHRLLFVVASLVAEHRPQRVQVSVFAARGLSTCSRWTPEQRLSSSGTRAELLLGLRDLPGPGMEPMSLALAEGFFTPGPPGKLSTVFFSFFFFLHSGLPMLEKDCLLYSP